MIGGKHVDKTDRVGSLVFKNKIPQPNSKQERMIIAIPAMKIGNKMLNHLHAHGFPQLFGMMFGLRGNNLNIRNV